MSGYCPDCGNTMCICAEIPKPEAPTPIRATCPHGVMVPEICDTCIDEGSRRLGYPKPEAPDWPHAKELMDHEMGVKPEARPDLSKTQKGLLDAINEFNKPEPPPAQAPGLGSELVDALREASAGHDAQAREWWIETHEIVKGKKNIDGKQVWPQAYETNVGHCIHVIEYAAFEKLQRQLERHMGVCTQARSLANEFGLERDKLQAALDAKERELAEWKQRATDPDLIVTKLLEERAKLVAALEQVWEFENCDSFQEETNEMIREALK